jgi:hypothetical protein
MYLEFVASRSLEGCLAAAGGKNVIVTLYKNPGHKLQDGWVIVNDQDGLLSVS